MTSWAGYILLYLKARRAAFCYSFLKIFRKNFRRGSLQSDLSYDLPHILGEGLKKATKRLNLAFSNVQSKRKAVFKLTRRQIVILLAAALLPATSCRTGRVDSGLGGKYCPEKSTEWAKPIAKDGLPNFHRVSADLYRGAQPSAEGLRQLKEMGIKTIVNLRAFHSDKDEIGGTDIGYEHISFKTWHPEEEDVVRFLKIVTDKERTPVFVHCQHGADRTGLMCAIYRVAVCGWSKEAAADEMVNGGFGFHPIWENLRSYLRKLDIEKVKDKAGIRNSEL
jgi:protein tyrosine phosphatase (PTP) superfamily phosphohydrolase (DUF442 family)